MVKYQRQVFHFDRCNGNWIRKRTNIQFLHGTLEFVPFSKSIWLSMPKKHSIMRRWATEPIELGHAATAHMWDEKCFLRSKINLNGLNSNKTINEQKVQVKHARMMSPCTSTRQAHTHTLDSTMPKKETKSFRTFVLLCAARFFSSFYTNSIWCMCFDTAPCKHLTFTFNFVIAVLCAALNYHWLTA